MRCALLAAVSLTAAAIVPRSALAQGEHAVPMRRGSFRLSVGAEWAHADDRFGTRHRAALSLSAQTDCVIVVVSEETGQVRIAYDGTFSRPLEDEGEIKKVLTQYIVAPLQPDSGRRLTISVPAWTKSTKVRRT